MPTFNALQDRLRIDVLSEGNTNLYSEADLLDFLVEASIEIASMGGFPTTTSASVVASGSTTVTAPPNLSNVEFQEVTFENYTLEDTDARTIRFYQGIGGQTRYYNFDPRSGGNIDIAPAAHIGGTVRVTYVENLENYVYSGSDTPWNGVLEDWNDAIVYLAGVKAFERSQEFDRAQYWQARLERRLQPLAIYLDNNNVLNVATRVESDNAGR